MDKYCKRCGAQLPLNAKFCVSCGTKTDDAAQQTYMAVNPPITQRQCINCGAMMDEKQRSCWRCGKKQTSSKNRGGLKKLIIFGVALLSLVILLVIAIPRVMDTINGDTYSKLVVDGQPYGGRAITISGDDLGDYDENKSRVTIDGINASIVSWVKTNVTVIVPPEIKGGKKKIQLVNPPYFNEKSFKKEFSEHKKTKIASGTLSPTKDNFIEGKDFAFIAPKGSVAKSQEIIIYKYDNPALDDNPYYKVTDEYEITDPKGNHVVFQKPVYFGVDAKEEEALASSIQIFDEYMGIWVKAETLYNRGDGRLYLVTDHFSGFRKFVSVMYKGAKREGSELIEYIYKNGKDAANLTVKLAREAYVLTRDATVEEFLGVKDSEERFIIYYRKSDAEKDPSILSTAKEMAAAFSTAYNEYKSLFGEDNVPSTTRKVLIPKVINFEKGTSPLVLDEMNMGAYTVEVTPDPLKVYIDPRYKKSGAKASIVTGNITMPSQYDGDNLASTCAHELFHTVQFKQLSKKQIFLTNLSKNMWFLEATAEYAGRFIGTSMGVGAPIHIRIDASKAYYAFNTTQEYGMSSFLDYIITLRQTAQGNRKEGFKELWNDVAKRFGVTADINSNLDKYVMGKLNKSTQTLYEEFWRDAFTRSFMPDATFISGGAVDIKTMSKAKITSTMEIEKDGVGIFRYNFKPAFMLKDNTAITRSFWLEASPSTMIGDVYRLDGLDMAERSKREPPLEGCVNINNRGVKDVLVPYSTGDSFGLIALFKSVPAKKADIVVNIFSTAVKWDNQKDIENKVSKATLIKSDKLKFTPVLPKGKPGDPQFNAVVKLNNNDDYKTEIDKVENGKPFEVNPPMKDLPPDKISVNIKIFRDGKLVHEYQSAEMLMDAKVAILGPRQVVYELGEGEKEVTHQFSAMAAPTGKYRFEWDFRDGSPAQSTTGDTSAISHTYSKIKEYTPTVTLYDMKGNVLSRDDIKIILKKKEPEKPKPTEQIKPTEPAAKPTPAPSYTQSTVSGTITMPDEGIKLVFTVTGGNVTVSTNDGWKSKYFIKGTVRPGETINISISGNGTNFSSWHHVNKDKEATMSISFPGTKEVKNSKSITIAPGDSGSLELSYVVPKDLRTVQAYASIGNVWINPYGGGSRTLILDVKFDVVAEAKNSPTPPVLDTTGIDGIVDIEPTE